MGKITHKVPILSKRILLDIFPRGMTVNVADLEGDTKEGNREQGNPDSDYVNRQLLHRCAYNEHG